MHEVGGWGGTGEGWGGERVGDKDGAAGRCGLGARSTRGGRKGSEGITERGGGEMEYGVGVGWVRGMGAGSSRGGCVGGRGVRGRGGEVIVHD